MKKLLIALLLLAVFAAPAWAAKATVTVTDYGYCVTGGTSVTPIPQDTWLAGKAYVVGNRVCYSSKVYYCMIANTSTGSFTTDLAAGEWRLIGPATIWLGMVNFYPSTSTDTAIFSSGNGTTVSMTSSIAMSQYQPTITFTAGNPNQLMGVPFMNLSVALTATTDVLNIFVNMDNFTQN